MNTSSPDSTTFHAATALASRAPSLFNTRPWRWRRTAQSLHLYLDPSQALPATDPQHRELTISCGAALDHAVLALRALDWTAHVQPLPDLDEPDRLADIEIAAPTSSSEDNSELARAAYSRRTDRGQYSSQQVSSELLADLHEAGTFPQTHLRVIEGDRRHALAAALAKAAFLHSTDPDYRNELATWTGYNTPRATGVPRSEAPQPGTQYGDIVLRDFGRTAATHEETGSARTAGTLLLVSTSTDAPTAHLTAGQATSRVLCTAERHGLVSSPLSEPFEIPQTRAMIRHYVLDDNEHPQLALRVGWPAVTRDPPPMCERPVREMLRSLPDSAP